MSRRISSLLGAIAIVSVALGGALWLQESRQFPWSLFFFLISSAVFLVATLQTGGGLHGAGGPWSVPSIFVVAVLMWWALIEGGRWVYARWRKRDQQGTSSRSPRVLPKRLYKTPTTR
jgi:hypothetical protein